MLLRTKEWVVYPGIKKKLTSPVWVGKRGSVLSRSRPRLGTLPLPHSYGNQRLQRQFDGLLMMGIVMTGTC